MFYLSFYLIFFFFVFFFNDTATTEIYTLSLHDALPTYTGWALRANPAGGNDGCDGAGQVIPFAKTKAERTANGDPRASLEERYATHEAYVQAVTAAANALKAQRLLLDEDVQRYIQRAE